MSSETTAAKPGQSCIRMDLHHLAVTLIGPLLISQPEPNSKSPWRLLWFHPSFPGKGKPPCPQPLPSVALHPQDSATLGHLGLVVGLGSSNQRSNNWEVKQTSKQTPSPLQRSELIQHSGQRKPHTKCDSFYVYCSSAVPIYR